MERKAFDKLAGPGRGGRRLHGVVAPNASEWPAASRSRLPRGEPLTEPLPGEKPRGTAPSIQAHSPPPQGAWLVSPLLRPATPQNVGGGTEDSSGDPAGRSEGWKGGSAGPGQARSGAGPDSAQCPFQDTGPPPWSTTKGQSVWPTHATLSTTGRSSSETKAMPLPPPQ